MEQVFCTFLQNFVPFHTYQNLSIWAPSAHQGLSAHIFYLVAKSRSQESVYPPSDVVPIVGIYANNHCHS